MANNDQVFGYEIDVKFVESGDTFMYDFMDVSLDGALDQLANTLSTSGSYEVVDVREIVNGLTSIMDEEVRNF